MRGRRAWTVMAIVACMAVAGLLVMYVETRPDQPSLANHVSEPSLSEPSPSSEKAPSSEIEQTLHVDELLLATSGRQFLGEDNETYTWTVERKGADTLVITETNARSGDQRTVTLQVRNHCLFQLEPSSYGEIPIEHDVYWFCDPAHAPYRAYRDKNGTKVEERLSEELIRNPGGSTTLHSTSVLYVGNQTYSITSFIDLDDGLQYFDVTTDPAHERRRKSAGRSR